MSAPTPSTKRNWNDVVDKSNGTMFFVPANLTEAVKEWQTKRVAFAKEVNRVAEIENEIGLMFTKVIYDLRKYFAENGMEGIWTSDIGFNTEALKDGVFILNITKAERQP